MGYLNWESIGAVSSVEFRKEQPYPWTIIPDSLTQEAFERLHETLPDISLFDRKVRIKRAHAQVSHGRAMLHYRPDLNLQRPWKEFVAELEGKSYKSFLRHMFGLSPGRQIILTMEWYYTSQGCSVSPHCDARRKLGTHIFFFNKEADWDARWGGEILILDDGMRLNQHSAPAFDDLKVAAAIDPRGNGSLLFQRTEHSWHGVRPLDCPSEKLRKLFIVTISLPTLQAWWRRVRGKDPDGCPLRNS